MQRADPRRSSRTRYALSEIGAGEGPGRPGWAEEGCGRTGRGGRRVDVGGETEAGRRRGGVRRRAEAGGAADAGGGPGRRRGRRKAAGGFRKGHRSRQPADAAEAEAGSRAGNCETTVCPRQRPPASTWRSLPPKPKAERQAADREAAAARLRADAGAGAEACDRAQRRDGAGAEAEAGGRRGAVACGQLCRRGGTQRRGRHRAGAGPSALCRVRSVVVSVAVHNGPRQNPFTLQQARVSRRGASVPRGRSREGPQG